MNAVIDDRGSQYLVKDGDTMLVDFLASAQPGSEITFDRVLQLGTTVGTPTVPGAAVRARVLQHEKGAKLVIQKFKRRKDYRRRTGHRQNWTRVTIASIQGN